MTKRETINLTSQIQLPAAFAIVGDTHIAGQSEQLNTELMSGLAEQKPDLILHTGDLMVSRVLSDLSALAPVFAVRGNRDLRLWRELPAAISFQFHHFRMILFHGYGNLPQYLWLKTLSTVSHDRIRNADFTFPTDAYDHDLVFYGHTHAVRLERKKKSVILNPGPFELQPDDKKRVPPSFGMVRFETAARAICSIFQKDRDWHVTCKLTIDRNLKSAEEN
jgi:putative phosphoesterase